MKPEIIVFDLYNTLIRITKRQQFFTKIFQYCQTDTRLTFSRYLDMLITKDLEVLLDQLPLTCQQAYHKFLPELTFEIDSVELFPETQEVIQKLASKYPLYLISNLASPYKKPFYDLGLCEYFENAVFSCDFGDKKPNSSIFKEVESMSLQSGEQILMIGDSLTSDITGAKNMSWHYLQIVRNKKSPKEWQITSLKEIEIKLL